MRRTVVPARLSSSTNIPTRRYRSSSSSLTLAHEDRTSGDGVETGAHFPLEPDHGSEPRGQPNVHTEALARLREDGVHETERIGMRQLRRRSHQAIFLCSMKSTSALTEAKALTPTSSSSTLIPNSCSSPSTSSKASIESSPRPSPKSGAS